MQTILGAGGVIGIELAKHLTAYTQNIRLVNRNPKQVNTSDELFKADLLSAEQVMKAVEGSEVVYLVAGLPYRTEIWQNQWPVVMQNTINACKAHNAKLVFFDNVYLYGQVTGEMTENLPFAPCSKKGQVRAQLVQMIRDEVAAGTLTAAIVRSADFYGPAANRSAISMLVMQKVAKGQKGSLLLNDNLPHSYTYTPDAGKYTALVGNTHNAYNQEWHLPTAKPAPTGKEFMQMVNQAAGQPNNYSIIPKWLLKIIGWFMPDIRESMEMIYQIEKTYVFNSDKFEKHFNVKPTPYAEGIKATISYYKNQA